MQTATENLDSDWLGTLNPAQRQAACHGAKNEQGLYTAGPLRVIAGAGTGKTMTLAHRVAQLVIEGVPPERILLLTFTRRAAEEMTRRVESIVRRAMRQRGADRTPVRLPWSGTFHSVGNRLLRQFAPNLGLDPGFSVLDRGDSADLMDVVRHELGLSKTARRFPKKDTCLAIYSRTVNTQSTLAETIETSYPWCADWEAQLKQLFRGYVTRKQDTQSLDYDDLLVYWSHLVGEPEFADPMAPIDQQIVVIERLGVLLAENVAAEQLFELRLPIRTPRIAGFDRLRQCRLGIHGAGVDREAGVLLREAARGLR